MQVRTGPSYWMYRDGPPAPFPQINGDERCDVLVIGGGVTGALVGTYLLRDGLETVLVDRGHPGVGSTAASTGLLQYEVDTPLCELIDKVGEAAAVHAYRRGLRAIDELEALALNVHADCGFSRRQALYLASEPRHVSALEREYECRRHFGFDVNLLGRRALSLLCGIDAPAAILSSGDAQIDPYRLTQGLLVKTAAAGLRVYSETRIESLVADHGGIVAQTARGRIKAKNVVIATGYESGRFLPTQIGSLHSTYALVSEPVVSATGWPDECLLWDTGDPYFYARQVDDGRIMIGGQDTDGALDHRHTELVQEKFGLLQQQFSRLLPSIEFHPDFGWAGTFAETEDGLAYIGKRADQPRHFYALGYGGNGITFSTIAARLITDLIVQRENADAPVFAFER